MLTLDPDSAPAGAPTGRRGHHPQHLLRVCLPDGARASPSRGREGSWEPTAKDAGKMLSGREKLNITLSLPLCIPRQTWFSRLRRRNLSSGEDGQRRRCLGIAGKGFSQTQGRTTSGPGLHVDSRAGLKTPPSLFTGESGSGSWERRYEV